MKYTSEKLYSVNATMKSDWRHIWQNIYRVNRAYHCAMLELFTGDPWSSSRVQISLLQLARLPWLFINLLIRLLWQENYMYVLVYCADTGNYLWLTYALSSVWLDKPWQQKRGTTTIMYQLLQCFAQRRWARYQQEQRNGKLQLRLCACS